MQCSHLCSYHSEVRTTCVISTKCSKTGDCLTASYVARILRRLSVITNEMGVFFKRICTDRKCVLFFRSLRIWPLSFVVPPKMEPVLPYSTVDLKGWAQLEWGTGGSSQIIRSVTATKKLFGENRQMWWRHWGLSSYVCPQGRPYIGTI